MRHVLFDTNVLLDVLLECQPFYRPSALALSCVDGRSVQGFVSAHAIPTIVYIADKSMPVKEARRKTELLCAHLQIAAVTDQVIRQAFISLISDFEDAMTHAAAQASNCNLIVTRNVDDFAKGTVRAVLPDVFPHILRKIP
jgi:hypothetical protein